MGSLIEICTAKPTESRRMTYAYDHRTIITKPSGRPTYRRAIVFIEFFWKLTFMEQWYVRTVDATNIYLWGVLYYLYICT